MLPKTKLKLLFILSIIILSGGTFLLFLLMTQSGYLKKVLYVLEKRRPNVPKYDIVFFEVVMFACLGVTCSFEIAQFVIIIGLIVIFIEPPIHKFLMKYSTRYSKSKISLPPSLRHSIFTNGGILLSFSIFIILRWIIVV